MPQATLDGITTHYDLLGDGPPLLMFAPGGFDATRQKWSTLGIYAKTGLMAQLTPKYSCIVFDRRETGESGGRVERVTWAHYVAQGKALLDHLGIAQAHLMGGCMGCSPVAAFGVAHPQATLSMTLIWPVGGVKYRVANQLRFAQHLSYVQQHGLAAVAELVRSSGKGFGEDPRGGPWAANLKTDEAFAASFVTQDVERYKLTVAAMARTLIDRDTAPGAEPEDLMQLDTPTLIIPGRDASHATSAARYLEECLPRAEYWDAPVAEQTAATLPQRVLQFLDTQPRTQACANPRANPRANP